MSDAAEDLTHRTIDAVTVRDAARGRWDSILPALGVPGDYLRNRHGPCPGCGGEDRFRYNDSERGGFICGRGGDDPLAGDGFDLLEHVQGWSFSEALAAVAGELGLGSEVKPPTPTELEQRRQEQAEARRKRETERQHRADEAAERAQRIWDEATATPTEHPYLTAKGVEAHGLKLHGDVLVVPMRDAGGTLRSLEFIDGDGGKRFLSGGQKRGSYHAIGRPSARLYVAEGYATAASIHEATGDAVAVAFDAGNLEPAARALRAKLPAVGLVMAADHDESGTGQAKAQQAAEATGGLVAIPPEAGDFNDLALAHGLEAVAETLQSAAPPAIQGDTGDAGDSYPPEPEKQGLAAMASVPPSQWGTGDTGDTWATRQRRPRYVLDSGGVWFEDEDDEGEAKEPVWVCGPLVPAARTSDADAESWGLLLVWWDPDGNRHRWAMPAEMLAADGAEYRRILLNLGLPIAPTQKARNHLTTYLQTADPEARARNVPKLGWHGPAFVLPDTAIGPAEHELILQTAGEPPKLRQAGTLEEWRAHVAALAAGNSRVVLALSAAFAGPLLELVGEDSGGIHFVGGSSVGKTVTARAAVSV